jgi:membrane-associated phospholipid phosphatase
MRFKKSQRCTHIWFKWASFDRYKATKKRLPIYKTLAALQYAFVVKNGQFSLTDPIYSVLHSISMQHGGNIWRLLFISICGIVFLLGCGTLPNGRRWGQDVTLFPGWQRLGKAALDAALSPATWVPAGTALALQIDDWDENISDWASDKTPVFGSQKNAADASDILRDAALADYLITALATPSGSDPGEWVVAKIKGLAVGYGALQVSRNTTFFLKDVTDRTRPDESRDTSFPSNHAAKAATYAMLASRNIESLPISDGFKTALNIGTFSLDMGTAWARVEAKAHFPSDVLAGMALGHFFGAFMNDAFLGLNHPEDVGLIIEPSRDGFLFAIHWPF